MPGKHSDREKRRAARVADSERGGGMSPERAESVGWATVNTQKKTTKKSDGFQLLTLDDYYASVVKAEGSPQAPGTPPPVAGVGKPKKYSRRLKPTVKMKPISDAEAMARLRSGTHEMAPYREKSLRWLAALKALATGHGKVSGGGALRAPNRGELVDRTPGLDLELSVDDLARAMEAMSSPSGSAKPPKVYLPGVHSPKSPVRRPQGLKKTSKTSARTSNRTLNASIRPSTSSDKSLKALVGGRATELSNSIKGVVHNSGGSTMANTNFNDIFKSELSIPDGETLIDCPHCDAPITKSDIAKAHGGKGKTTHESGAKRGKSSAHVVDQNPEGGTMRGGDGHGVITPSRGVPGAKKTDEVRVQSAGKRKGMSKAEPGCGEDDDSSGSEKDSGDDVSKAKLDAAPAVVKKSITIRGTDFVQYIDDGSDAELAKAIAEGRLGGTSPTRPLDLNNDLTRLLV